jgi:23S rRNA pseudouridine1911/1915/1917 synthase
LSTGKRVLSVTAAEAGQRLEAVLAARTGLDASSAAALTAEGRVLVDGRRAVPGQRLSAGQRVVIHGPSSSAAAPSAPAPASAPARPASIYVHHRDPFLIVVEKPAGLPVQPGRRGGPSLIAQLTRQLGRPPTLLHRLDTEASGLVLLSLDPSVNAALSAGFAGHTIERVYLALVHGRIDAPVTLEGRIAGPPPGHHGTRRRVLPPTDPSGQLAITHVRPSPLGGELGDHTLLEVRLETGRTHQIRAQLAHAGHPLAGDRLYGPPADRAVPGAADPATPRLFLHACRLTFTHPVKQALVEIESLLPASLDAWLAKLRLTSRSA